MNEPTAPQALTGMRDVLSPETARWRALVGEFADHAGSRGFEEVSTPILEELAVYQRLGEGTDVVTKEMYDFEDRDGRRISLRPESTAGVARAFVQHRPPLPWRVWYFSQHFRHEKPQKGRYRQHHQLGAECFGVADPDMDVEIIALLWDFYARIGLRDIRLELNSIGEPASRRAYLAALTAFLDTRRGDVHPEDRPKIDTHPFRVLDSKRPETIAALDGAPTFAASMSDAAIAHFDRVTDGLTAAGIPYEQNTRLVRGLDYYTHTVFEIVSDAIDAAQSTIGGGGRYDGLVAALGGPDTPGVGFGSGVERVLLACDAEGVFDVAPADTELFVVSFGGDASDVRDLVRTLRAAGFRTERAYDGRSAKAQMKVANRSGARYALLTGDDERAGGTITLRDLRRDVDQESIALDELVEELGRRMR